MLSLLSIDNLDLENSRVPKYKRSRQSTRQGSRLSRLTRFLLKNLWLGATSVIISNPQSNPQCMMSCTTSACFGSPRSLLSRCNTYERHLDTVEVCGSSPHGPTIFFNNLETVVPFYVAPSCSNKTLNPCIC